MSKKSRKRNRKILGALAAGLGAVALANRKSRAASIADNEAKESGFGQMKLKDYGPHTIGGGTKPVLKAPIKRPRKTLASPKWNKMDTSEVTPNIDQRTYSEMGTGKTLASPKWNKMNTSGVTLSTPKKVTPWIKKKVTPIIDQRTYSDFGLSPWGAKKGGRAGHSSGGKVKLAKRGLGRAFTKAKK